MMTRQYATAQKTYYGSQEYARSKNLRTKLAATFYEFQFRFRAMKARRLTAMDSIFASTMLRMQRINSSLSALVATESAAMSSQEVLRKTVYANHRLLRSRIPVTRVPTGSQNAFLAKAAQFCTVSGKFVRNHWVKILGFAFLVGSIRYIYKHGQSQMHQDRADLTVVDRLRKTKDNMLQRIEDEYHWRWNDLWCYGPIITVWGNWWSRTFQKSSMHDTLLDLLI